MAPLSPLESPQRPVADIQSVKSVTPPGTTLFGTRAAEQSRPFGRFGTAGPATQPGVSMVASQFTNVTTLVGGRSKVKLSVAAIALFAASESSAEVIQGVTVPNVLPSMMNF